MKYCCFKKFLCCRMQMKPLEIWGHGSWGTQYATTWTTKQTHSKSRAGWDVRSIERKYSPPSPDIQALTVSLQQHGAVVNCRGLETPAALETWGRRGEDWLLMKVGFWNPTQLHLLKTDIHTAQNKQAIQYHRHLIGGLVNQKLNDDNSV